MKQVGFRYAGVAAFLMIIVFLVSYYIGVHPFIEMSHLFFDLFIYGLVIYFALNDDIMNGPMFFWANLLHTQAYVSLQFCHLYENTYLRVSKWDESNKNREDAQPSDTDGWRHRSTRKRIELGELRSGIFVLQTHFETCYPY